RPKMWGGPFPAGPDIQQRVHPTFSDASQFEWASQTPKMSNVPDPPHVMNALPMSPSSIGLHKSDLDTPAYCIDVDVMDANIARMASFLAERGKQWRPHAKCHKSPIIARREIDAGAIGVTVAKVS